MARSWLSIRVDLVEGRGDILWPRTGRSPGTFSASYTPAELDDLLGFVAAESNHARTRKLQARLDELYALPLW